MATGPVFSVPLTEFVAALLAERELVPRARTIARHLSDLFPRSAVIVYVIEDQESPSWHAKACIGEVALDQSEIALDSGTLSEVAAKRQTVQLEAASISRENYAHLDIRQSISSLSYIPLFYDDTLLGCIEIVSFDSPIPQFVLESFDSFAECAALGI